MKFRGTIAVVCLSLSFLAILFLGKQVFSQETVNPFVQQNKVYHPLRVIPGEEGRIYVFSSYPSGQAVQALDAETGRLIWDFQLSDDSLDIVRGTYNKNLKEVYFLDKGSGKLLILKDMGDAAVISRVSLEPGIHLLAINETTNEIYVAHNQALFVIGGQSKKVNKKIEIQGIFSVLGVNKKTNRLHLLDSSNDKLIFINPLTGLVIKEIVLRGNPTNFTFDLLSQKLYAVDQNKEIVSIIDTQSLSLIKTLPTGHVPLVLKANEKTRQVYIVNGYSHNLSVVDILNDSVSTADLPADSRPEKIAIDAWRGNIYVEDVAAHRLLVLDESLKVRNAIDVKRRLEDVNIDRKTGRIYAPVSGELNCILVIDQGNLVKIIGDEQAFRSAVPLLLNGPFRLAMDEKADLIYVANSNDGTLLAFSADDLTLKKTLFMKDNPGVSHLVIFEDGKKIALLSSNTNQVIITDGSRVLNKITVGKSPDGMTAQSGKLYVLNRGDNSVSVIDPLKGILEKTVGVGKSPASLRSPPNSEELYVVNAGSNSISVINTVNDTVTKEIKFNAGILGLAFDGDIAYALKSDNSIAVIDLKEKSVKRIYDLQNQVVSISPFVLEDKLYFVSSQKKAVIVWNTKDQTVKTISLPWEPYKSYVSGDLGEGMARSFYVVGRYYGLAAIDSRDDRVWFNDNTGWKPEVAFHDGKHNRLLVTSYSSNTVSVFKTDNYDHVATIFSYGQVKWDKGFEPQKAGWLERNAILIIAGFIVLVSLIVGFFLARYLIKKRTPLAS